MSQATEVSKCSCTGCGVHLEFPLILAGTTIVCPNCQQSTPLIVPPASAGIVRISHAAAKAAADPTALSRPPDGAGPNPPADALESPSGAVARGAPSGEIRTLSSGPGTPEASAGGAGEAPSIAGEALPLETLLAGFKGKIRRKGAGFFYQLGLLLVTGAIVILPLIYLAMVLCAAYGVFWWATHFAWLLGGTTNGRLLIGRAVLYFTPLFTGGVVVLFMVKPLLARAPRGAQPLALNPSSEPALFAFIAQICQTIGAPFPSRIDVDCELNASAGFRRGFKSLLGNDLVLTIGLPLAAGLTVTQLAGIIAHEFGHFTQHFAMRLNYIVRRVSHWFARVIYERDQWDLTLERWAAEADDWRIQLVVGVARLGVWFSRLLLKGLMWIGVGIGSFVSRQMEYDADRSEIQFVGSRCFEETTVRFATLGASLAIAFSHLRASWNTDRVLPESFPRFLALHEARLPAGSRVSIADRVGLERAGVFSTHPASGDRIRRARQANAPGVFEVEAPASALFGNFEVLARQVSLLHYTDDLEIPQPLIKLLPALAFFESAESKADVAEANAEHERKVQAMGPSKLKLRQDD